MHRYQAKTRTTPTNGGTYSPPYSLISTTESEPSGTSNDPAQQGGVRFYGALPGRIRLGSGKLITGILMYRRIDAPDIRVLLYESGL